MESSSSQGLLGSEPSGQSQGQPVSSSSPATLIPIDSTSTSDTTSNHDPFGNSTTGQGTNQQQQQQQPLSLDALSLFSAGSSPTTSAPSSQPHGQISPGALAITGDLGNEGTGLLSDQGGPPLDGSGNDDGPGKGPGMNPEDFGVFSPLRYQAHFDVTTKQVGQRIGKATMGFGVGFLEGTPRDAWGPFWVASTLVMVNIVASNVIGYWKAVAEGSEESYTYDFSAVALSSSLIFGYLAFASAIIWAMVAWGPRGSLDGNEDNADGAADALAAVEAASRPELSFVDVFSVIGYGLSALVVGSIIVPIVGSGGAGWVVWLIVWALSAAFTITALFKPIKAVVGAKYSGPVVTVAAVMHGIMVLTLRIVQDKA